MLRKTNIDPFFFEQPPLRFIEELKRPLHQKKPDFFGNGEKRDDEISVDGIFVIKDFPDEKTVLKTIYDDFEQFVRVCGIAGNRYPIRLIYRESETFESYEIVTSETETCIFAGDTEGIRRALVFLEDMLISAEGPFLPKGTTKRKPCIKTRITRGFFSPTNRPPKSKDELFDDVDYYPDAYLNRLMHDGTNGIWIYTRFADLLPSSYIEEYGTESLPRIQKLNAVVEKCARYGIGVYIFAIEPYFFRDRPQLYEKYAEARGAQIEGGHYANCLKTKFMQSYIKEAGEKLTKLVPDLRGWISITVGEGLTHCASNMITNPCPRCGTLPRSQVLAEAVSVLQSGLEKSDVDFVSWTYAHRLWEPDEIRDYVRQAPSDAILMQNFEDVIYEEQLGKQRVGIDYWLSGIGPSERFRVTAEEGKKHGKRIFAKMQVCCSHEVASVPYVPVPGILYKKYKEAVRLGVEGIVQCWYFGNYPSVMSRATGILSFMDASLSESEFLLSLAALYWGRSRAEGIKSAWECFEKGYRNYPLNVLTSYYGPMHDGIIWELALCPKNFSLPRTWRLEDKPDGDRIYDCLGFGHSLSEVITLTERMKESFEKGTGILEALLPEEDEMLSVARCLSILFASGNDIFRFYHLRDALGKQNIDGKAVLSEMQRITEMEIKRSNKMTELCQRDGRLGYHSEAEGYKFFPQKLQKRIESLKTLLETEFATVRKRMAEGLPPLAYYNAEEKDVKRYAMKMNGPGDWEPIGNTSSFRAWYDEKELHIEFCGTKGCCLIGEFVLFSPTPPITADAKGYISVEAEQHASLHEEDKAALLKGCKCTCKEGILHMTFSRKTIRWEKEVPFKIIIRDGDGKLWQEDPLPVYTLGRGEISPGDFGWFLPENYDSIKNQAMPE